MSTTRTRVPDDVIPILRRSTFNGNVLTLPEQLDRETYLRVAKVLTAARGKWNRKANGHVFPFDPRELIGPRSGPMPREAVSRLGAVVEDGVIVDAKKALGFFETSDALVQRLIGLSGIGPGETVLEPSAGLGRIAKQLLARGVNVVAVEIDPTNAEALRQACPRALDPGVGNGITVHCEPFEVFQVREAALFDAVIMNPPFADNLDMKHIRAAWEFVRPGRRLIAICSEGPFFRQDTAAREFRTWLEEIGADAVPLPANSFRESGTDVATRIIFCPKPEAVPPASDASPPSAEILDIPMDQIEPDPDQPRQVFEPVALRELAASIRADGLLQPIAVRPSTTGRTPYQIAVGERRWRAHQINKARTIRAIVVAPKSTTDLRVMQIIENDQRSDVTPLEQAKSYHSLMETTGWTVEELAARIGKAPHRIIERTALLNLRPEYQALLASGNLKPSEATELVRLSPRGQDTLFNAIRTGGCRNYNDLRASSTALVHAEQQLLLMPDAPPPPTKADRDLANAFEAHVERVATLLRSGIHENQIVAVRKTSPHRAGTLADLLAVMQTDLRRIEVALREVAIQASFLDQAA
jgi:ParB/RepB/Spo0J family partition protein